MTHTDAELQPATIDLRFHGAAGQSFGAWLVPGVRLTLTGEANDYVGKGMHGGEIVVRPPEDAGFDAADGTIAGNTVLYGATGGSLYLSGKAGERFAVRNSGAMAVVEGVGDHGCEYMTEGVVVVLGRAGRNFGAGMSGGLAFVLDQDGSFPNRLNRELVRSDPVSDPDEIEALKRMIQRHHDLTGSPRALEILKDWPGQLESFWRVAPKLTPSRAGASASDAVAPDERDVEAVPEGARARGLASRDAGSEGQLEAPPL
jgi:glutamate synthase domain-containing protein 3